MPELETENARATTTEKETKEEYAAIRSHMHDIERRISE